jgi:hypothetical protein
LKPWASNSTRSTSQVSPLPVLPSTTGGFAVQDVPENLMRSIFCDVVRHVLPKCGRRQVVAQGGTRSDRCGDEIKHKTMC